MVLISMKEFYKDAREKLATENSSVDNLLWLVNILPSLAGFSHHREKISVPFWIVHISMLIYVYVVGTLVYQVCHAQEAKEFIKSYVNVSLCVLIANNSYWFICKRSLLMAILKKMKENDDIAKRNTLLRKKYESKMYKIKIIILIFYGFNYGNFFTNYLPHRGDVDNDFAMTPCVGLEPLTSSPNRELCRTILSIQEITITIVVLNYQSLLLLLIAHTAAMYSMMSEEIMLFNDHYTENSDVKETLPSMIRRHVVTLDIIEKLKSLYSIPIGVNFFSNAVCMSLFFYLPLPEWLAFIPILVYCFLVFFLYCFLCQNLVNASQEFERAVYSCGWENFNVKEKKTIYVMLILAQKQVDILAADIIPVNIYTFATTIQAMFKFVTVMKF